MISKEKKEKLEVFLKLHVVIYDYSIERDKIILKDNREKKDTPVGFTLQFLNDLNDIVKITAIFFDIVSNNYIIYFNINE